MRRISESEIAVECPCAGRPLSGEERTVGYHNDANQPWESCAAQGRIRG